MTGEIAGPDFNGGIGTANRGLAMALQKAGFAVDVLYTQVANGKPTCFRGSFAEQVASFRGMGINLMCIAHDGRWDDWLAKSLLVMEFLQSKSYDIAFFDDTHGSAYYTALARRSGNQALAGTKLVVVTHGATQWVCELNQSPVTTLASVQLIEIERRCIELADHVVSPSAYILGKYATYGWKLPENTAVRPNILPFTFESPVPPRRSVDVDEVVFFGRLERRKGLWLFCEALDRMKYELAGKKVTFLGKFTLEDGESTGFPLLRRSAEWPFTPTLLYNYDRDQALSYLKAGNRLAVMPSREDNSPCVILECLIEGIPFIASSGSGGQELIHGEDHTRCLFEPSVEGLTASLRRTLSKGHVTAQASFSPQDNASETIAWISALCRAPGSSGTSEPGDSKAPAAEPKDFRQTLLLLVPDNMSLDLARDEARAAAEAHADCSVVVFSESGTGVLAEQSRKSSGPANLRFCALSDFAAEVDKQSHQTGMLVMCRLDQPVPPEAMSRLRAAMQSTGTEAFTMMRGHANESPEAQRPFFACEPHQWTPESYKTGNAGALMVLTQSSNSGLLAMNATLATLLARQSPRDPQLCRLKDVELFIHEVLLDLVAAGHSFELLPDCYLPDSAMAPSTETYDFPAISLRHLQGSQGMTAGSEAILLSRLPIEIFAGELAQSNARELLGDLAARVNVDVASPKNYWPLSRAMSTYASIAHATGRPELALSLAASSLAADKPKLRANASTPGSLARYEARTLSVTDLAAATDTPSDDAMETSAVVIDKDNQLISMVPSAADSEPATLAISDISLAVPASFSAEIELAQTAKGAVKFEAELLNPSAKSWRRSWVLLPGERKSVGFPVPPLHDGCSILLKARMVRNRDTTEGAHANWHQPALQQR